MLLGSRNPPELVRTPHFLHVGCAPLSPDGSYLRVGRVAPAVLHRSCALVHVSAPRTVPEESNQPADRQQPPTDSDDREPGREEWITAPLLTESADRRSFPRHACALSDHDAARVKSARAAGAPGGFDPEQTGLENPDL